MARSTLSVLATVTALVFLGSTAHAGVIKVFPDPGNGPIAAAVAQLQDGDKLILNAGTYDERLNLVGLTKVTVIGKGKGGVLFDGIGPPATISITDCDKVTLKGLTVRNAPTQGILVLNSTRITLKACTIEDHSSQGIQISASEQAKVLKCTVTGGTFGIEVSGASTATLTANTVADTSAQGIQMVVTTLSGTRINRNTISGSGNAGLTLEGTGNKADKNKISDCLFGIVTPFAGGDMTGSTIVRNTVTDTVVALRTYATGVQFIGNKVVNATASAAQIATAAQDVILTRTKVVSANAGIDDEGTGSIVSRNKITNTTNYGIRPRGVMATFERNTVKDTAGDGFDVWTGGHVFSRNKATGNAGLDLNSTKVAEDQNTFEKNTFGTVEFD
jgi:hypothetical protein